MADVIFSGMRGTGEWSTDERDYSWREGILKMYPNGKTPLTAIMSKLGSEVCGDPWFNWFFRVLPDTFTELHDSGVYSDAADSVGAALTADNSAAGTKLWLNCEETEANAYKFRAGQHVVIGELNWFANKTRAQVTGLYETDGTDYYVQVRLLEADTNVAGHALDDCTHVWFGGHSVQEGVGTVPSRVFDPTKAWNYLAINRTSWDHTGSALAQQHLRTGDRVMDSRFQGLEWHSIDLEHQGIFGIRLEETSEFVKKDGLYITDTHHSSQIGIRRRSGGVLFFLEESNSGALIHEFTTAETWSTGGEAWLDANFEEVFRYGNREKVIICGSGALLGLQSCLKNRASIEMTQIKGAYGMDVLRYYTPFGTTYWVYSPLMTQNPVTRSWALILDTEYLKYRHAEGRDTHIRENIQLPDEDRVLNEFFTEWGLELHFPMAHGIMTNVGME